MARCIELRDIERGPDRLSLWATLTDDGDLLIEGEDVGPGTAPVTSSGEYSYSWHIPAGSLAELGQLVGLDQESDLLDHLAAEFSGPRSWELEGIVSRSGLGQLSSF